VSEKRIRYWLLYDGDTYYIKEGTRCTWLTSLMLQRLAPLKSIVCEDKQLAYKILIGEALAHHKLAENNQAKGLLPPTAEDLLEV
jgi:hypothetical protein